jgi:hypothetical protein
MQVAASGRGETGIFSCSESRYLADKYREDLVEVVIKILLQTRAYGYTCFFKNEKSVECQRMSLSDKLY